MADPHTAPSIDAGPRDPAWLEQRHQKMTGEITLLMMSATTLTLIAGLLLTLAWIRSATSQPAAVPTAAWIMLAAAAGMGLATSGWKRTLGGEEPAQNREQEREKFRVPARISQVMLLIGVLCLSSTVADITGLTDAAEQLGTQLGTQTRNWAR